MSNDLFGQEIIEPPPKKRKDPTPAGYAGIPGKGPVGETCGTCTHHAIRSFSKNYHKCGLMRAYWTGGRHTDILVRSPACAKWEAK